MNFKKIIKVCAVLVLVEILLVFAYLCFNTFFGDSEFWSVLLGYYLPEVWYESWVLTRPLFYFALWMLQIFPQDPVFNLMLLRGFFLILSLAIAFYCYKISYHYSQSKWAGLFSIILLFTNSGFLNQGFRIRSDILASLLTLIVLHTFIKHKSKSTFLSLVPLLATPKSVIFSILLFTYKKGSRPIQYIQSLGQEIMSIKKQPKQLRNPFVFFIFSFSAIIIIYFISRTYEYAFSYLINSFSSAEGGVNYFSSLSWIHIAHQIQRNLFFWVLFAFKVFVHYFFNKNDEDRKFHNFIMFSLLFMLIYPDKTQFFIAAYLPLYAIYISLLWRDLKKNALWYSSGLMILMSIIFIFTFHYWSYLNWKQNSNQRQLQSLQKLDQFFSKNRIPEVYDVIGLSPFFSKKIYFVGPNQATDNQRVLKRLEEQPPHVILFVNKMLFLAPKVNELLAQKYIGNRDGIFLLDEFTLYFSFKESNPIDSNLTKVFTAANAFPVDPKKGIMPPRLPEHLSTLFLFDVQF